MFSKHLARWGVFLTAVSLGLSGCGDRNLPVSPEGPNVEVIIEPQSATITAGDTIGVAVQVLGHEGNAVSDPSVNWRSADTAVAVVDSTGLVTGKAHGATTIIAEHDGFERAGMEEYSRALELQLDPMSETATQVWEFRPYPDNYAPIISSARRLQSGNTIGTSTPIGQANMGAPVETYEVSM